MPSIATAPQKSGSEISQIVDPEITLEARRCIRITNVLTGNTWERQLDPRARWDQAYLRAVLTNDRTPGAFELEMEEVDTVTAEFEGENGMERIALFTMEELNRMNKPRLDEIGRQWGVKSSKITTLKLGIMEAQNQLVEEAKLENVPGYKKKTG